MKLSFSKTRGQLYQVAKLMGDINAVKSGSPQKMVKRVLRKQAGKMSARGMSSVFGKMFK